MSNVTNRKSNIELLRIIAMTMIVASHCCLHGVINNQLGIEDLWMQGAMINKVISASAVLGNIGVGIFFSITGFFAVKKDRIDIKAKLITDVICFAMFNALLLVVLYFSKSAVIDSSNSEIVHTIGSFLLTPITGENWWFVTAYIYLVVFISPVANMLIKNTKNSHLIVIVYTLLNGMVLSMYLGTPVNRLFQATAYYVLGIAIGNVDFARSKVGKVNLAIILIAEFGIHSFLNYLYYCSSNAMLRLFLEIVSYTVIAPIFVATLFLLIQQMDIGERRRINAISASMLGVYLFHDSSVMRSIIWGALLPMKDIYFSSFFPVALLLIVLVVLLSGISFYQVYSITVQKRVMSVVQMVCSSIRHSFLQESEGNE